MKADKYGTPTENSRWSTGWMPSRERKAARIESQCRNCKSFVEADSGRHQGEHCVMHGFSMRAGAVCRNFRAQEAA
ncbi:MAG: hypothetical protein MZV65_39605 [Chromatiales bacterium]|nr:hypothetical protein [Chromatiales bacterium]MCK7581143.1 hypothetical protein [Chromatiales bacterium]